MAESSPRRYAIGYALPPKKQQSFIQPSLVSVARDRGIDLVPIDPSCSISDQGHFDCIIHQLYTEEWKAQIRQYTLKNHGIPVIDPPDAIERLHNRISMLQVVSTLSELNTPQGKETIGIPRQVVIYDSCDISDSSAVGGLHFPVIAKPLVANGSANSHEMALVFNHNGVQKLKPPIVLQEFVNHGGVIFKVYVVGDYVKCVKRKSLPDVSEEMIECSEGSLPFSQVSNMATQKGTEEYSHLEEAEMPPLSFITEIATELRRALGLHLFNFDMIRDVKVGHHYLVIDINYFPGYAKLPSYETIMTEFFWNLVHKKKEEDGLGSAIEDIDKERKL